MPRKTGVWWPDAYVAGAPKCGTTTVYARLKGHPEAFVPTVKETDLFLREPDPADPDVARILALYRGRGRRVAVDCSPSYFTDEEARKRIRRVRPDARIVLMLRDPVQRAYSHYLMSVRAGRQHLPFREAVEAALDPEHPAHRISRSAVGAGRYGTHVRAWIDTFGRDQVHIMLSERLRDDPDPEWWGLAGFLAIGVDGFAETADGDRNVHRVPRGGLARLALSGGAWTRAGRAILPRRTRDWLSEHALFRPAAKPRMDDAARARLVEHFEPEISDLERLLHQDLPELRRSWRLETPARS